MSLARTQHLEGAFARLVARNRDQFFGYADVALAVGRVFEQLAEAVAIAFGRLDVLAFNNKPALRLALVHDDPIDRAMRQQHVVSLVVRKRAERSFKAARAFVYEVKLVGWPFL